MIEPSDLDSIRSAISQGRLDEYLTEQEKITEDEYICSITWSLEDLYEVDGVAELSDSQVREISYEVAKVLKELSIEEGWRILQVAVITSPTYLKYAGEGL
jgi:hypothetical protein